nr:metallophosphoesterase family protein [Candidatus Baldrarchaeota archaeon]
MLAYYKDLVDKIVEEFREEIKTIFLPRLVPIIPPKPEYSKILKEHNIKAAILEYYRLEASIEDWRSYLDYDGMLLLSAVMPDEMLYNPSTFGNFLETAGKGFDGVIGWDMPVEVDIPLRESWSNLVKCLEYTTRLASELDIPVIPLSKGANREQAETYVSALSSLGFKTIALHASEYALSFFREGLARRLLEAHIELLKKYAEQALIIGVLNPAIFKHLKRYDTPKFSYAGLSWLLHGEEGYAYTRYGKADLKKKTIVFPTGEHLEYPWKKREIVKHNLEYMLNLVTGAGQARIRLYDIALEGRTLVVSDIHAGTRESMLEDLLEVIKCEDPENIVFLGDTFDLQRGEKIALDLVDFFGVLAWVSPRILPVLGDADTNFQKVLSVIDDALTLQESWHTLPKPSKPTNYHILAFYKFYRKALPTAAVYLPDNSTAYMLHGHQFAYSREAIVKEARNIRRDTGADWIFIAHTHKAEINREEKIVNTGCWVANGENAYVIIEKDGSIELLEEF